VQLEVDPRFLAHPLQEPGAPNPPSWTFLENTPNGTQLPDLRVDVGGLQAVAVEGTLVREYRCYQECKDFKPLPWEEDYSYQIKDKKGYRAVFLIGVFLLNFFLSLLILWQAQMPIHRGNITATQYYDNCNHIISYNNINLGKHLNNEGLWLDQEGADSGIYCINILNNRPLPPHELTITNGFVTGVKIETELKSDDWILEDITQKYIAIASFLAAQKETNAFSFHRSTKLKTIENDFENYTFVEAGIRVTNKVEYSGYTGLPLLRDI
jgi:hypothetical protein